MLNNKAAFLFKTFILFWTSYKSLPPTLIQSKITIGRRVVVTESLVDRVKSGVPVRFKRLWMHIRSRMVKVCSYFRAHPSILLSPLQSAMSKNCIKLLCEDPVFAEYIKCILMDERTFLNNNIVYTFMTHFLLKVCDTLETQSVTSNQLVVVFALCWSLEIFFFFLIFFRFKVKCFRKQTVPI